MRMMKIAMMNNDAYLLKKTAGQIALEIAYDSIFPNKCLFCRRVLDVLRENICGNCRKAAIFKQEIGDNVFENIYKAHVAYDYDEEVVRHAVLRFKYEGKRLLARAMARGMFEQFGKPEEPLADFIVCVPLHESRMKERGFNQSALLAVELSGLYGLPAYDGLLRSRETAKQFDLNPEERAANVAGVFAAKEGFCVAGKDVLLMDDVLTTGATAMECAGTLMKAGAGSVSLMTFAAVKPWGGPFKGLSYNFEEVEK